MFDWLKRKTPSRPAVPSSAASTHANEPNTCSANPGKYLKGQFAFARGDKKWEEEADVMNCIAVALKRGGHSFTAHRSWVEIEGGFTIMPRFLSFQPLEKGGVRTVTTIEVSNPAGIPPGVFEFQHSTGDNLRDSFVKGFESWAQTDLPVLIDALREQPTQCTYLQMEPREGSGTRRVVLGPVAHLVPEALRDRKPEQAEEHPFCPCCLFTRTSDIWREKISAGGFYGVRLFAMRGPEGESGADCRVNGLDWEEGKRALINYVNTWPDLGVEFRKQYIVLQNGTWNAKDL